MCTSHGVGSSVHDGLWSSHGPPPPLHSGAVAVEPWALASDAVRRVDALRHCSVADSFARLDLDRHGFDELFTATWLHYPPLGDGSAPVPLPPGWARVTDTDGLRQWTGGHDTGDVLLPGLLSHARFAILARREDEAITAGAIAHLGTGAVYLSNVHGADVDWHELLQIVASVMPGRAVLGYERGPDLDAARAAGFSAVGEHRVWAR